MLSILETICTCISNTVTACFLSMVSTEEVIDLNTVTIDQEMELRELQKDEDWQNIEAGEYMKDL